MTQNEHVYVICCRQEAAGDVISTRNVESTDSHVVVNFEVASYSLFQNIKKIIS